ncbi:hypothetical protein WA026_021470 [Henosepilachna vigintioctopunctata]|uniref:Spectrin repeats metazoan domain-containing protein n=1 Tax=Henosepilachna vigintioctopunctata TaxID=420089 RepID=A0AAW1UHC5_9CUCU
MDSQKNETQASSLASSMAKTTTISTIAVQSGKTRIVIALLHCGNWLQLKILEITPELTKLGNTLQEAVELQKAHDEVLRQIKSKQSPVEELLRQADQLIATQKPRAEVYAAMAETLGRAWRDINFNLELRKQILDLNVQYHSQASEFFNKVRTLEQSCTDTVIPIEIQAVKEFLTSIHDLRRNLLESLMAALQAGNSLLGKLKELGAEGTLDSRPDHIRQSVNRALSQVQSWLDELHCKREDVEAIFNRRKLQLEQCLALAILAADLRQLEEAVNNSRNRLANADQLGDSMASAELLQVENKKLLPEAQLLQEKALKITKATEQLLQSGCFAGEEATKQSYAILSLTSDYLTEVQNRSILLERVVEFFRSAQSAFNKLSHLEEQIKSSNLKTISHDVNSECAKSIEEITAQPIAEGYAILDAAGRGSTGTEGVRRTVEELENVKIRLDALFAAQREESLRINRALESFFNSYQSINSWLTSIADAFLQSHQNMGNDLPTANDFMNLHNKLHTDLQGKGNEINALLLTLPPIVEYLDDERRRDVDVKVEDIHDKWMKLKSILENRLDLGRIYVKFHKEADIVNSEIDKLEDELRSKGQDIDDEMMKDLEIKWESIEPLYQSAKNTGLTFINDIRKVSEPHLDSKRACGCVEAVLEKLAGRQLQVTRNWQSFYTDVIEKRELLFKLEEAMVESTRTINWVTKLETQLYPVIATNSSNAKDLASFVANKLDTILPDIKRAQNEVDQKIKTAEMLISKVITKDEKALNVKNKLSDLNHKLIEITNDFQMLLQMLIAYFNSINDLDLVIDKHKNSIQDISQNNDIASIKYLMSEHEASKVTVNQMIDSVQNDRDRIIQRILKQEPSGAAEHDIAKLKHILEQRISDWKNHIQNKRELLEKQYAFCQFDEDLNNIYNSINSLEHKNNELKSRYGKSLEEAQMSSSAYAVFEKTIQDLDIKIKDFIEGGNKLLSEKHSHSPLIQKHIRDLEERWDVFKKHIHHTRYLIDQSIKYFQLVNEVNEWFKQGSRLLIS